MTKLCQTLAIDKQVKTTAEQELTALYHLVQREPLFQGISRTYKARDEEGERFPDEKQEVQQRVPNVLEQLRDIMSPIFDLAATKDKANCSASADVELDGNVLLRAVPAVTLLYLEKQLVGLHTLIGKLPELPQTETWEFDSNADAYRTAPVETAKTKKIAKSFVKYEATKEHPAQVDLVHDDVVTGYWTTIKFSGALPRERKRVLRERVERLLVAVKFAREQANQADAPKISIAKEVFAYVLAS